MNQKQSQFRNLTIITAVAIYILMIVGGVVRITESGLGCPDWPLCHGGVIPPLELTAIIEYTHRFVAGITGVLIVATVVLSWMRHRHERRIVIPATVMVALLALQIPLGAVVVASHLDALYVTFHLGMALLVFACALLTALGANQERIAALQPTPIWYRILIVHTLLLLFVLLLTGALVVGSGSNYICPDWPTCNGRLVPVVGLHPAVAIQILHRGTAFAVSLLVIGVIVTTLRFRIRIMTRWAILLGGLFAAQIAVGALQVISGMPGILRVSHLALASGVWASLVVLGVLGLLVSPVESSHTTPRSASQSNPAPAR